MDKTNQGHVTVNHDNGIATIEFYHPSHNSLPGNLLAQLAHTISTEGNNPESTVIVIKSAGDRTFCAGASFDELVAIEDYPSGKDFFMGFANVINAMRKCPKFIIGRIQGKAVGGGVGLAASVDYCMASKYASVKLSELAVGIGPFVVGPACERKLGLSAFNQMAINASEWQTAVWAKDKGLFHEVFDSTEQLDEYIRHFCQKLVSMSREAQKELKTVLWSGTEDWDNLLEKRAEISGRLVLTEASKSAISKFLNA